MGDNKTNYRRGDKVEKVGGDYGGPGEIVEAFEAQPGKWRYIVAHTIEGGYGRFLHIYAVNQIRHVKEE